MKYRKKPVVIEAMQFNGLEDYLKICEWFKKTNTSTLSLEETFEFKTPIMLVNTLEGTMSASKGDYIIKGVNGEFYPCKPDIFEKTYDVVSNENFAGEVEPLPDKFDFPQALHLLKVGFKVKRPHWGGYWFIPDNPQAGECMDKESGIHYAFKFNPMIAACLKDDGGYAPATPYQDDLLADDWELAD